MTYCDLHVHSTVSDGTTPPRELAMLAKTVGLSALALTDHDTTAGVSECADACRELKIRFVPGVELSADPILSQSADPRRGTLHILGLFVDPTNPGLQNIEQTLRLAREQRNPRIIENLNQLGVRIDYQEVLAEAGDGVVGRPHVAQVLLNKGYVKSIKDAFSRYIGEGAAAYARKDRLAASEAIAVIHSAGGLAVLAHPVQLRLNEAAELTHYVAKLKEMGLDGLETRHSDHRAADVEQFERLAQQLDLLTTGGSDYHGSRKRIELGGQRVPYSVYETLYTVWRRKRG